MQFPFIFLFILQIASAKISGGPRGRFDKNVTTKYKYHVSAHHTHYSYHPPKKIYFRCKQCNGYYSYPVFKEALPTYIYQLREAGGRYSSLLAGLALYNLAIASDHHWQYGHFYSHRGRENCSMQIIETHKHFEETAIPCFMLSAVVAEPAEFLPDPNAVDVTSPQINIKPFISYDGAMMKVTLDQDCVLWRNTTHSLEKYVTPCALLKEYAETMKPSGIPVHVWLPVTLGIVILISIYCQCCNKRKVIQDDTSISDAVVIGYSPNTY